MEVKKTSLGLFSLFLIALLLVASSNFALAQVSASISGRIEDPSGSAIPGATVTVTSMETGVARTVSSDGAGNYRALSLPVGRYEVKAEKEGFKVAVQMGIALVVAQEAVVNLKLEVGTVQQEVTVTGEAALVNTTTASVSGLVGEEQVKDLPINGRSFDLLITLNPGTINYTSNRQAGGAGFANYFSVAGRRPPENLFLLNGVEYTGASLSAITPGGVSGELLGIDAVREFNVLSGTYSAEYGKRAGGQISVVTQSGTNHLHGSLFEFLRNSDLDARNFFDFPPGLRIPPFRRNQFGGAAGGPIRKDKTFIFANYEGFRQRLGLSDVTYVPDLNARIGLLPNAQGVETPVANLNPGMLKYLSFWPLPTVPPLGQGIGEAFSNPENSIREDFGTMRFDQTLSGKDSLSAAYTIDDGYNILPSADPLFVTINNLRSQVLTLQETHIFSPSVINNFTVGFSRAGFASFNPPATPYPASYSFVTGDPPGGIIIGGGLTSTQPSLITAAGAGANPTPYYHRTLFTYTDGIQLIKGKHHISAGIWLEPLRSNEYATARPWGNANFSSLTSFLQGTASAFFVAPISTPMAWRSLEGAWYLQDAIQLRPNLTLSLGVRHEFTNGWNEANGRAANYIFDPSGVFITNTRVGNSALTENNAKWLFGPRVGLAWDPFGKGKTSIRAGFGTHHDLMDSTSFLMDQTPPFNGAATFSNVPLLSLLPINTATPIPPGCGPGVPAPCTTYLPKGIQSSFKTPAVQSWNFTVEQQLTSNLALRVAYMGSFATHQWIFLDPNAIQPLICSSPAGCVSGGNGSARGAVPQGATYVPVVGLPNPYVSAAQFWFAEGNASYNALSVDATQRLGHGLMFRASYTWSKNLDILSGVAGSQSQNEEQVPTNIYHLRQDWGPSALNITSQASGNFSYELPIGPGKAWGNGLSGTAGKLAGGWQVNAIVTLLSGFPFTPEDGSTRSGNGDSSNLDRPNVNPAFTGPVIIGSPNQWFNPNAFILQTAGTFGNLGRGTLNGPGLADVDFSLFKNTRISERFRLQFRAEFFNILNHSNFGGPNAIVFSGTTPSPTAGAITSTATTSRQVQFGLKLLF